MSTKPRDSIHSLTGPRPARSVRHSVTFGQWQDTKLNYPRRSALRPARDRSQRHREDNLGSPDESWIRASDNAFELEWQSARSALRELAQRSMTAAETGVRLQSVLQRFPSLASDESGLANSSQHEGEGGGERQARRELLPLPLPQCRLVREAEYVSLFPSDKILGPKARELGAEAWLYLVIASLNGMDSTGGCVSFHGPITEAQTVAMQELRRDCVQFVKNDKARTPTDFKKELGTKMHSYWGEPVFCAVELTLPQVIPTLPIKGVAASVDICKVLDGQPRDQLRDPESLLLPEAEWPSEVPRATTMMKNKKDYPLLANEMWQRDLALWLPTSEIFHARGVPVVSGLMGVGKGKDVPDMPGVEQLRLICNLIPSNGYFREIKGDVAHLPYMLQWASLVLMDDEVLLISQEDMTCAFYLFRLPRAWCPYFAVGLPVKLEQLTGNAKAKAASQTMANGADTSGWGYLVLQVLPMGWKSAVGIMQAVHRRLMSSDLKNSARLPGFGEVRKTGVMPSSADQRTQRAWQVYLDNYASLGVHKRAEAEKLQGKVSEWHAKARACWEANNIPSAQDKSLAQGYEAKELGAEVDGVVGTLGSTVQRRLDGTALTFFLASCEKPHRMWLAVDAGRWNFIVQFRRPASGCLFTTWQAISRWHNCQYLPKSVVRELLNLASLSPILVTKLRSRPDLLITCSDASTTGAGVAASAGLTDYGVWSARGLPAELPQHLETGVAVISLFGGIEAGRRALDLLGIRPVRHISVENNKFAIRATAEVYPDIVHFRDVKEFTRDVMHGALAGVRILRVLILAGFPCQGLSGANALKLGFGDDRTLLFFEAIRIVKEVQAEKHSLDFLFENVASMDNEDRDVVSRYAGVRPVVACASGISQVRRKRYLWSSWPVTPEEGVIVTQTEDTWKISFEAKLPDPALWTDPGWEFCGERDTKIPTFMRSLPKKKQTHLPAGLASTPSDARRRWVAHKWRYPPYQYKKEFCFRKKRQPRLLRVASATEREVLMFLGRGATLYAMNPVKAKQDPVTLEDERCSLIGNSFHAGVFALVLGSWAEYRQLGTRASPQAIVDRMGLYPGEVFVEGLSCGLGRPPSYHRMDGRRRGQLLPSFEAARAALAEGSSTELELKTLTSILRSADYRGSDVRLDSGELLTPGRWPRRSIDPAKWNWYPLVAHEYKYEEHINVLEVRAAHLQLRWRSRSAARIGSRFFHLLDSQVAIAVLVKGRSSSWRLNKVLARVNALTLAGSFFPTYGYFMSEWNPSDPPSRRWEGRKGGRGSWPRRTRPRKRGKAKVQVAKASAGVSPAEPAASSSGGRMLHGYNVERMASEGILTEDACMGILTGLGKEAKRRRNAKPVQGFDSTLGYPGEGPGKKSNRAFPRNFDSTLGYPGEGPRPKARPASARRTARSRLRVIPTGMKRLAERIPGRRTVEERRAARAGIPLRPGRRAPITTRLYVEAFYRLWSWVGRHPPEAVTDSRSYDLMLALYVEQAWTDGATRGEAGNALSASIAQYPELRGKGRLTESWYMLNAWSRYEIPMRAPPMPPSVAVALAWYFVRCGHLGGALIILVGYDCFLRTGEMLSLTFGDIVVDASDRGIVKLEHTKTGRRHAAFEASAFNDPICGRLYRALVASLPKNTHPDHYIFTPSVAAFYKMFKAGLQWLGLEGQGFLPYSVRRGGATAYFRVTRNMEATLDRGRWSSSRVARIYVNDGLAREIEIRLTNEQRSRIDMMVRAFAIWLPQ